MAVYGLEVSRQKIDKEWEDLVHDLEVRLRETYA